MTSAPQLRPLGDTLGTEALGIDLSKPLDEASFAWIGRAFAENPVLVFRDQDLGAAELAAFGRRFGHAAQTRAGQVPPRRTSGGLVAHQCRRGRQGGLVRRQARHRLAYRFDL